MLLKSKLLKVVWGENSFILIYDLNVLILRKIVIRLPMRCFWVFVYQRDSSPETEEWEKRLTGRYELLDSMEMGVSFE